MFVEIWLHHYSLEMYQKLQSPQVKVRITPPPSFPLLCSIARLAVDWLTTTLLHISTHVFFILDQAQGGVFSQPTQSLT